MHRVGSATWLATLVLFMGSAGAASFNCAQATTPLEKQVCADAKLSALDEELARAYKQVLDRSPAPDDTRESQRRWIRASRDPCKTPDCLARVYGNRIGELVSVSARLPFKPDMSRPSVSLPALAAAEAGAASSKPLATRPAELIGRIEFAHDAAGGRWDFTSGRQSYPLRYVWQVSEAANAALGRIADAQAFVLVRGRVATVGRGEGGFIDSEVVEIFGDKF